jgi:hypothetical protein
MELGKQEREGKKPRECGVSEKIHVGNSLKDALCTIRWQPARLPCGIYSTKTAALGREEFICKQQMKIERPGWVVVYGNLR